MFIDSLVLVLKKPISICTDFLNPKEQEYAISLLNNQNVNYSLYGGFEGCERAVLLIGKFLDIEKIREDVGIIKISSSQEMTHPSILGSLLGLGIERKKVGDVVIDQKDAYIVVKKSIANFILVNLEKVGKYRVEATLFEEEIPIMKDNTREKTVTVSSMRIDVILSSILHLSRGKANTLLQKEYVKVNYEIVKSKNKLLNEGDMISVRKEGRFYIKEILGKSKKDKYILKIEKLI